MTLQLKKIVTIINIWVIEISIEVMSINAL